MQKKTDGLSTTQKVASIGSASFTVMTIVALFVRAAMCTGEWQWILHACYRLTGCRWLHPTPLQWQQSPMKDKPSVMAVASSMPDEATCSLDLALDTTTKADADRDSLPSSPGSMDSSTFEEWKKQS